jgi:hypothetical protein
VNVAHFQFWIGLFCGVFLIVGAIGLARSGELRLRYGTVCIRRTEMPVRFWALVFCIGAWGVVVIAATLAGFFGS